MKPLTDLRLYEVALRFTYNVVREHKALQFHSATAHIQYIWAVTNNTVYTHMLTSEHNAGGGKAGCERSLVIKHILVAVWRQWPLKQHNPAGCRKPSLLINAPKHTKTTRVTGVWYWKTHFRWLVDGSWRDASDPTHKENTTVAMFIKALPKDPLSGSFNRIFYHILAILY